MGLEEEWGYLLGTYGVFVVVEADLLAEVLDVWAIINHALGIVDIAILAHAARRRGSGRVGDVDHEKTPFARQVTGSSHSVDHVLFLMRDDVVGRAEARVPCREVSLNAECFRLRQGQELNIYVSI